MLSKPKSWNHDLDVLLALLEVSLQSRANLTGQAIDQVVDLADALGPKDGSYKKSFGREITKKPAEIYTKTREGCGAPAKCDPGRSN